VSPSCGCDEGRYVEVPDDTVPAPNTVFCGECRQLIPAGTPYYRVRCWQFDADGDECDTGLNEVCEVCGDLAVSFLERGFCWAFGSLKDDIRELCHLETFLSTKHPS